VTSPSAAPALSAIVLIPDRFDTVARVVAHLAAQDHRGDMELVMVGTPDLVVPAEQVATFHSCQRLSVSAWHSTAVCRALGVAAARAPIVAFVEDHCYPTPGWAHALLEAHREDWAGVGPVILNANPARTISWANLLIEYGPWLHPRPGGAAPHIPGHNSSYKRDRLLAYGDRLASLLEAESVLHWDLAREGWRVAIEPLARSRHENFACLAPSLRLRFHCGRLFAASRAAGWSRATRLLYAAASPALPLLRAWRLRAAIARHTSPRRPLLAAAVLLLLAADAFGELVGYASGPGDSSHVLVDLEFHRERFSAPGEALTS
jgi:hypothetical protein